MEVEKIISGDNPEEIWKQIGEDLKANEFSYTVVINYKNSKIIFSIEIDPGGGFEGGYQTTMFQSELWHAGDFKFAIHHQGLLDEIGKFFGMQDIETGYEEFDKKVVVKSNDEGKVKSIFADAQARLVFKSISDFTFHITKHNFDETDNQSNFLELTIEEAIVDSETLRTLFNAFYNV
ncbi:MAG: hypothetical protein M3015_01920, partial [Bacteroidota bacterium]|nr:hypothetical protein [Bacteroidota bacterium]